MSKPVQIESHQLLDKIATAYTAALIKERNISETGEDFDKAVSEGFEYAKEEQSLDMLIELVKKSMQ